MFHAYLLSIKVCEITSNVCKIYGQQNRFTNKRVLTIACTLRSTETPIRSTCNLVITQDLKLNEIENIFTVPVRVEFLQSHCLQLSSNLISELTNSEHRMKSLISFKLLTECIERSNAIMPNYYINFKGRTKFAESASYVYY